MKNFFSLFSLSAFKLSNIVITEQSSTTTRSSSKTKLLIIKRMRRRSCNFTNLRRKSWRSSYLFLILWARIHLPGHPIFQGFGTLFPSSNFIELNHLICVYLQNVGIDFALPFFLSTSLPFWLTLEDSYLFYFDGFYILGFLFFRILTLLMLFNTSLFDNFLLFSDSIINRNILLLNLFWLLLARPGLLALVAAFAFRRLFIFWLNLLRLA